MTYLSVHTPRMEASLHNELQKAFSVVSNNGSRKLISAEKDGG